KAPPPRQSTLFPYTTLFRSSGSPTHSSSANWQKVGSGGGTLTWVSAFDRRPDGISAQVDIATNKRIDIRKDGVWMLSWRASLNRSEEHTSELQSRGHLVCRL